MIATSLSMILAAALAGQRPPVYSTVERPPTVRYVSLPDSAAPDLAPGEILVPGSVYEVVADQPGAVAVPAPSPAPSSQAPTTYAAPAAPSSSCYSSSYQPSGMSYYAAPAPAPARAPAASYAVPGCPGGVCRPPGGYGYGSVPMQATPAYARPGRRRERVARGGRERRERLGFGLSLAREGETRSRTGINLGFYPTARQPSIFSGERWGGAWGQ